ncbi:PAS domain S-box protein [uncultured Desulfosarcina sp.]|uniref:hybrid sensor histidine kinase/response regulator n=1 Tax=uncultured Desulfosarcina sp. TaxID=218289 RepID=UPI0029C8C400|nr:PAS domain S-box protein [uncultured Desulfosarcina sp.]
MSTPGSKRNAERLRVLPAGILDAMREPAAVLDTSLRILNAGPAFCRFWGRSPDQTEGRRLDELTEQLSAPTLNEIFAPLLGSSAGPDHETPEVAFDLSGSLPMRMSARRIDAEGNAPGFILLTLADPADGGRTATVPGNEDERRFRILADAAFEGIAFTRKGTFVDLNDRLARMLGYRRDELIGSPVADCVALEDRSRVTAFMAEGRLEPYEHLALRKDGTTFPVQIRVRASIIDGRETRITAIRDITERKKAEEALALTQFTIDRASLGCSWIRRDGRFFYVNDHICRSLGYSRQELLQMSVMDIDPGFDMQIWDDYWTLLLRDNVRTFETNHQRKDGTIFPVEITANYVAFGGMDYSCAFSTDISERKRVQETLLRSQFSIDRASEAIFWMGREGDFLYVNDQACRSLGYTREELMGLHLWDIDPHFPKERWQIQWQEMMVAGNRIFETIHRRKDGTDFPVEISSNHIMYNQTEHHHVAFVRDISYRKRAEAEQSKLEAQLHQAQKMESIGRLAGGVAHDFNNMLGVILGYADLIKADLATDPPLLKKVLEIEKAAKHSRDITTQLLAFSRKQVVSPQVLNLNARIRDLQKTLARLIGEDIDLQVFAGDGLWTVRFDPIQIEQILINLAVNARDAMPGGGKLTIETVNNRIDEAYCQEHAGFIPGDFVRLSMSDNGSGMEPETLAHVFEPFFTTKEVGKGTGLGLATVYGIVKQGGGFINAYSEPGQGTTFTIYLPREDEDGTLVAPSDEVSMAAGKETVLLVEDDEMVRVMTRTMLERIGYTVLAVSTPEAALAFFEGDGPTADLLMTDVVMPVMNGKELHDRIAAIRPDIKTLFMSGYTANVIVQHGVLDEGVNFIQKPFSMDHLARMVRKALT